MFLLNSKTYHKNFNLNIMKRKFPEKNHEKIKILQQQTKNSIKNILGRGIFRKLKTLGPKTFLQYHGEKIYKSFSTNIIF